MEQNELYEKAKRRVEEIKGFYVHLVVFVLSMFFMIIINVMTSPEYYWFKWPLLGWGIGVIAHGVSVFGFGRFLGQDWEERKTREIMHKMESRKDGQEY